jgi:hypothetical protein
MKTIKKRLNLYTKNILMGWGPVYFYWSHPPQSLDRRFFFMKKTLWKGNIISMHWEFALHKLSEWTICLSKPRCYGDCMLLVKKPDVNSKNKQDPNPSRYFLLSRDWGRWLQFHKYLSFWNCFWSKLICT